MMKDKRIKIGVVGVDSGQLVICDPCYIKHNGEQSELNDYDELLKKKAESGNGDLNKADEYAQLCFDMGHEGLGVVFDSGIGDGVYNVYATIGEISCFGKRVKKVEVILDEHLLLKDRGKRK